MVAADFGGYSRQHQQDQSVLSHQAGLGDPVTNMVPALVGTMIGCVMTSTGRPFPPTVALPAAPGSKAEQPWWYCPVPGSYSRGTAKPSFLQADLWVFLLLPGLIS